MFTGNSRSVQRKIWADYLSVMWPLQTEGEPNHPSPCSVRFHIDVEKRTLTLDTHVYGVGLSADVTSLVEPGKWFNVVLQWGPESDSRTEFVLLVDGKPVATKVESRRADSPGVLFRMGVPGNGGQPWVGAMDELEAWNGRLEAEELAQPPAGKRRGCRSAGSQKTSSESPVS